MDSRTIRVVFVFAMFAGLFILCYPHFVPQDRTIILEEANITFAGENGKITSCSYDGFYIDANYTFCGNNYTTGEITKGFLRPLLIQKDREQHFVYIAPEVVDFYFNDPRFLSFQFYVDHSRGNNRISFIKGVCNGEEFHYKTDLLEDINYGKWGYEADCRLLPHEADITYYPDSKNGMFMGMIVVGILTALYLIIDIRIFP